MPPNDLGSKLDILTPKEPSCNFWQHRNLGQLTTNEGFYYFSLKFLYNMWTRKIFKAQ